MMSSKIKFKRLLEKHIIPDELLIEKTLGVSAGKKWKNLNIYLSENYDFKPELIFFGKKYGWCYRFRRKGKTLCVLFPENKSFTVLVVLGKNEIEHFKTNTSVFGDDTNSIFEKAFQYHDGKWIYKRVLSGEDLEDIKNLIGIKKKPKRERGKK
jgi:hypothetical protein